MYFIFTANNFANGLQLTDYQNFTYNAAISNNVKTMSASVEGFTLNISLSSSNAFGLIFGPARLILTISIIVKRKDSPIQMWKGIS